MICHSYDQLTIIEKTQLVGRLTHLIQNDENAFTAANELLRNAESNGLFDKVVIFPQHITLPTEKKEIYKTQNVTNNRSKESLYIPLHSQSVIDNIYNKAIYTLQKSYHKFFSKLAS